jgi:hypothetical protein
MELIQPQTTIRFRKRPYMFPHLLFQCPRVSELTDFFDASTGVATVLPNLVVFAVRGANNIGPVQEWFIYAWMVTSIVISSVHTIRPTSWEIFRVGSMWPGTRKSELILGSSTCTAVCHKVCRSVAFNGTSWSGKQGEWAWCGGSV